MEVYIAINIKVETLFRGGDVFREGWRKIARGDEIFPLGDFLPPVTLYWGDFIP